MDVPDQDYPEEPTGEEIDPNTIPYVPEFVPEYISNKLEWFISVVTEYICQTGMTLVVEPFRDETTKILERSFTKGLSPEQAVKALRLAQKV